LQNWSGVSNGHGRTQRDRFADGFCDVTWKAHVWSGFLQRCRFDVETRYGGCYELLQAFGFVPFVPRDRLAHALGQLNKRVGSGYRTVISPCVFPKKAG